MNFKKFISGVSALTIAASAFAGLAVTANATLYDGSSEDYLGVRSMSITLEDGEEAVFRFTNTSGDNPYNNWIACVHDNTNNLDVVGLRADGFDVPAWSGNGVTRDYTNDDINNYFNGASVVSTFTYSSGSVTTKVVTTGTNNTAYTETYTYSPTPGLSGTVNVFIGTDHSSINVTSASKTKYVVPSGYDEYGIGEVVFGTEYSDGTVADETFDSFPAPANGSNGWSGTMTNVGLATGVSRYLNINENAATEDRSPETIPNNYIALSGNALQWSQSSAPIKSFTNAVSHGIVRFNASYYQGTHKKTVAVRDSSGNPVVKLGYSSDKSGALSSDLFTMGTTDVSSMLYVRSASMRVKNVAIDLDKGTIIYDADYCNRSSETHGKDGVTSVTNQKAAFTNTDIKDIAFTSESTNKGYYANLDNVALYATMPTTRHAVTFTVTDTHTSAAIEGATVSVSGYRSATTDANGQATLYIDEADMSSAISVTKDGYANGTGTITEDNGVYTCAVAMDEPTYTGTITTNPNTTVTVTGTSTQNHAVNATVVSNYQGVATISAYAGSNYTVTASKNGYTQGTTSITITNDNAATASVSLSPSTSGVVYYEDFNNGSNMNFTSSNNRRWRDNRYQLIGKSGETDTLAISDTSYDIYTITAKDLILNTSYDPGDNKANTNSSSYEIRMGDTTFAGAKVTHGRLNTTDTDAYFIYSGYLGSNGNKEILVNNAYNNLSGDFVVTIDKASGAFTAKFGSYETYSGTVQNFDITKLKIYMNSATNTYPSVKTLTITGSNYPSISKPAAANGSYTVTADGSEISKAKAGTTVTVTPTADSDYQLGSISVTKDSDSSEVTLTNNTFEMPDEPVTVTVTFVPIPTAGYTINTTPYSKIELTNTDTSATSTVYSDMYGKYTFNSGLSDNMSAVISKNGYQTSEAHEFTLANGTQSADWSLTPNSGIVYYEDFENIAQSDSMGINSNNTIVDNNTVKFTVADGQLTSTVTLPSAVDVSNKLITLDISAYAVNTNNSVTVSLDGVRDITYSGAYNANKWRIDDNCRTDETENDINTYHKLQFYKDNSTSRVYLYLDGKYSGVRGAVTGTSLTGITITAKNYNSDFKTKVNIKSIKIEDMPGNFRISADDVDTEVDDGEGGTTTDTHITSSSLYLIGYTASLTLPNPIGVTGKDFRGWTNDGGATYKDAGATVTAEEATTYTATYVDKPSANFVANDWTATEGSGYTANDNVLTNAAGKKMYAYKAELTGNGLIYNKIVGNLTAADDSSKTGAPEWNQRLSGTGSFTIYLITNMALTDTSSVHCE